MSTDKRTSNADRWTLIEEICYEAMQRVGADRHAFLTSRCGSDLVLRREIEALLEASELSPDFLEDPVLGISSDDLVAPELPQEKSIGPYRVVRPLGHGGMGDVFLGVLEGDGFTRTVAIKVIRKGLDTARVLRRFRLERRILAELGHPNIAALIDGGATEDGRPYFVMEFVDGTPIDEHCRARDLPLAERLRLVRTVCSAVHHAHQNLVVHRDIKPGNILVTPDGTPVLLDFGIGKLLSVGEDDGPAQTIMEERALTPGYAAPEQLNGGAITTATDVYSLGVLLYELITGALPHGSDRAPGTVEGERAAPPAPSRHSQLRVPRELDAIVAMALREDPGARYSGPTALSDDLGRLLEGRPVAARSPGIVYSARKFIGRNRIPVAAGVFTLLMLLGGSAYTWRQSIRVAAERDRALEVRSFLLETFGAVGADRATGDSVTARALLDGQAEKVVDAYADDPVLQAEMMTVLAEGYDRLGLLSEAEEWARAVLSVQTERGLSSRAGGIALLGWITHQQGQSQEAMEMLSEAVGLAEDEAGGERSLARALNDLGVVQESLGDYTGAAVSHRRALELRASLFGAQHRSVAVSASNLSAVHYRLGELDSAIREAERALAILQASLGSDHQRSIIVQSNLAVFKIVNGDLPGAEADYRDLLQRQERLQGPSHPVTIRVMSNLATVLRRQSQWDEAELVLRETIARLEGADSPNPADLGTALATLGAVVSVQGDLTAAVSLIQRALDVQVAALGPVHVDVAESQSRMSEVFERADSLTLAMEWRRRTVETLRGSLGLEHDQTQSELSKLETLERRLAGSDG